MAEEPEIKKKKKRMPLVTVSEVRTPGVMLSRVIENECETVRFIAHHVVDRLCDIGNHKWCAGALGTYLEGICLDVVSEYMMDLVREARAAGKEVRKKRREVLRDSTGSVTESADAKKP